MLIKEMTVTLYDYEPCSNSKYQYKVCVKSENSNLVFKTNRFNELYHFMNDLNISIPSYEAKTVKKHFNYYGELECIQTIYYIRSEI